MKQTGIISALVTTIILLFLTSGCAGCTHRHRRAQERHRNRTERMERHDSYSSGERIRNEKDESGNGRKYSAESLMELSESEDFDAMLQAEYGCISELKSLKNEYFKGNMSDKEAEERVDEIKQRYAPVQERLNKASSEGLLTYNQHKEQMRIVREYTKLFESILTRLCKDVVSELDM